MMQPAKSKRRLRGKDVRRKRSMVIRSDFRDPNGRPHHLIMAKFLIGPNSSDFLNLADSLLYI
jgi:hypothetical protein